MRALDTQPILKTLMVTNRHHIGGSSGGVQTCTHEYIQLIEAAGLAVDILEIDADVRLHTRLRRALRTSPYHGSMSPESRQRFVRASRDVDLIFLNQVNLAAALGSDERLENFREKVVLLSHGAETTDLLNLIRGRKSLPLSGRLRPTPSLALRNVLIDEINSRRGISSAVCLSPFDADFERWLGTRRVTWIPRTVVPRPLPWHPVGGRFGYLGTLDHAPNLEGLVSVLHAIDAANTKIAVRIVGGPTAIGRWLAERFRAVDYLGPLNDSELAEEAASWTAFLNPIFCQARGCSTKLATALAWEIPILTTSVGRRGYVHDDGEIATIDEPAAFVDMMRGFEDPSRRDVARDQVRRAARSTPSMVANAAQLRAFLRLSRL